MFEHFLFAGGIAALIVWVLPYLFPPLDSQAVTAEGFEIPVEPEEDRPAWADFLFFKKGGDVPAPDPNIGKAALEEMELGRNWLAFAKEQFQIGNARQEELDELTKRITEQQLQTQDETNAWAREDRNRYKSVFQPLQDAFIEEAKSYNSPERQEAAAAKAMADVQQAASQAAEANARAMARMGINPASGRYQESSRAQEVQVALAKASAANNARQMASDKGLALLADAINIGAGLPSSTASAYGLGLNAGNSASGNALGANANWLANVGIMGQGYQGAMQGLQGGAGILNQQYGNQISAWAAQQQANATSAAGLMGGIGTIAGAGITAWAY